MHLGYGQLQQLMMDMNGIPSSRATAVSSRIRYMNRMDFPRGLRVGKGGRSTYDVEQALAMAVAFELLQCEMSPLRTVRTVRGGWDAARQAFIHAWRLVGATGVPAQRTLLATVQYALDDLAEAAPPSPEDAIADGLFLLDAAGLEEWAVGKPPGRRRLLLLDPVRIIETLHGSLPADLRGEGFSNAMEAFCRSVPKRSV